jgi:hypothetical protein
MTFHHTFKNGHTTTATLTPEGLRVEWQPDVPALYANKVGGAVVYLNLATGEPEIITPSQAR